MKKKLLIAALTLVMLFAFCLALSADGETTPTAEIFACNLEFGNQVYILYAVDVSNAPGITMENVGLKIERADGGKAPVNIVATEKETISGKEYYVAIYKDLVAKEMGDIVTATPYVEVGGVKYEGAPKDYSICTYAARMLGLVDGVTGTDDENLIKMLRDMLRYGASAQIKFNYKTDALASAMLDNRINVTYNCKELLDAQYTNPNPSYFPLAEGSVKLQPLIIKGYIFRYWRDEMGEPVLNIDTSKPGDITLYPVFEAERYPIIYENTKGVRNSNVDIYDVRDAIHPLPLEKYDYDFNGWRLNSPYGDFVGEDGIPAGTTGAIVLYADWTLKPEFEGFYYVVDENYNIDNKGTKFCMLMGVENWNSVTNLTISSVFNHIKEGALANCRSLNELTLPYLASDNTVTRNTNLGYLFGYASNAEAEGAIPTSLRKLTVTGGVIGDYAFANLKNVAEIVLSPEVTKIGYKAFLNCEGLEDLTMPLLYVNHSTRRAADEHGYVITQAEYYDLPGWVDREADSYDGKTFKLHINGGGILHAAAGDANWEKDGATIGNGFGGNLFELCKGISEVTIDNITVIPQFTFAKCSNLKKVTIGDTVQNIMSGAFWRTAIEEIVIPDTVKEMGEYWYAEYSNAPADRAFSYYSNSGRVFAQCKSLKKVVIGNGVVNIPAGMFTDCTNLEEIIIGENVRFVDCEAFLNTNDTFEVINNSTHKEWVISGPVSGRFMNRLMASANAPEKIYYGNGKFDKQIVDGFTETQIKDWHIVFYSPTDPYAEGGGNSNLEYWYHEDGAEWYKNQYTVTPIMWVKQ